MISKRLFTTAFCGVVLALAGCPIPTVAGNAPAATVATVPLATKRVVKFAPTYKSTAPDIYTDAQLIYDSSPKASQGVYQGRGLVFVIVEIDTEREGIRYPEGTAMLRTISLLRGKYPKLPEKFTIPSRLMEKRTDDESGMYRYATAWRLSDINKATTSAGK